MQVQEFQTAVLDWFDRHGRKDLPWQSNPTPYRVWVSEIMLQQTQVTTVLTYYGRFMEQFPDLHSLAAAPLDAVLQLWSGLGYYARARHLHKAARIISERYGGELPIDLNKLCELPGIGRSTAGAILSMAFQQRAPILDGNVKRVLTRFHAIEGWPGDVRVSRELWRLSEAYTPNSRVAEYTQAMMDLGATLCTRNHPQCARCPVNWGCAAYLSARTSELPVPRPKKNLIVRRRYMLVWQNEQGSFYLENRPPAGVWGGLWSFPEYETKEEVIAWCRQRRIDPDFLKWLPTRRHTFSHFHLDYTPVLARAEKPLYQVSESGSWAWCSPSQSEKYGLPAPVRRLIEQLSDHKSMR